MTSVEEHANHIAGLLVPALRVAEQVDELPLFRNSQMDGFAVRSADVTSVPVRLPVAGDIPAGPASPPPLGATIGRVAMQSGGLQATAVVDGTPCRIFRQPCEHQVSFAIFARAELLIDIPAEATTERAGDNVRVWSL